MSASWHDIARAQTVDHLIEAAGRFRSTGPRSVRFESTPFVPSSDTSIFTQAPRSASVDFVGLGRDVAFELARRDWPGVALDADSFREHLDQLGWSEEAPPEASSVFLCLACARGDETACRLLEKRLVEEVRAAVRRVVKRAEHVEDALQVVRNRLFSGTSPRILTYRGAGPLGSWLRIVATRISFDQVKGDARWRQRHAEYANEVDVASVPATSIESALFRRQHSSRVEQALSNALRSLESEDRRLLCFSLVQGLGVDALGRIYGVHRSTAARRLVRVREQVYSKVRVALESDLGELDSAEMCDLVQTLSAGLDASISTLLASAAQCSDDEALE